MVGKEGKAAFEARYARALPLSEYFVTHLAEDIDISHADGKARFVAEARPLLERVPAGTYRELLLDRLASAIGVSAERFMSIVGPMNTPAGANASGSTEQRARRPARTAHSTGRGGPRAPGRAEPAALPGHRRPSRARGPAGTGYRRRARCRSAARTARYPARPARPCTPRSCWNAGATSRWAKGSRGWPPNRRCSPTKSPPVTNWSLPCRGWCWAPPNAELDALIEKERQGGLDAAERERLRELLRKPRG